MGAARISLFLPCLAQHETHGVFHIVLAFYGLCSLRLVMSGATDPYKDASKAFRVPTYASCEGDTDLCQSSAPRREATYPKGMESDPPNGWGYRRAPCPRLLRGTSFVCGEVSLRRIDFQSEGSTATRK
jgi:hypothetical protein